MVSSLQSRELLVILARCEEQEEAEVEEVEKVEELLLLSWRVWRWLVVRCAGTVGPVHPPPLLPTRCLLNCFLSRFSYHSRAGQQAVQLSPGWLRNI